jgi:hypothetical protein
MLGDGLHNPIQNGYQVITKMGLCPLIIVVKNAPQNPFIPVGESLYFPLQERGHVM